MQGADDAVAVDAHARIELRRKRLFGELVEPAGRVDLGQRVEAHDLAGHVVGAAGAQRKGGDFPGRSIEMIGMFLDGGDHGLVADVLVHPVGGEQEHVPGLDRHGAVIDVEVQIDAERAGEEVLLLRHPDAMVLGELHKLALTQPVDAGVADVEQVCGRGFHHQRAQGRGTAAPRTVGA